MPQPTTRLTLGNLAGMPGTYRYLRRGTQDAFPPDRAPDIESVADGIPFADGHLLRGFKTVAWSGTAILDQAVDIEIELPGSVFIDRIVIRQDAEADSTVGGFEILCRDPAGALQPTARHLAPVGSVITEAETVLVLGAMASSLRLRVHGVFKTVALKGLDLFGCAFDVPFVFPWPVQADYGPPEKAWTVDEGAIILLPADASPLLCFAARQLSERAREGTGRSWPVRLESDVLPESDSLRVRFAEAVDPGLPTEGYLLDVNREGARLCAGDLHGFLYGVETMLALVLDAGPPFRLPLCRIEDAPAMALRGVHLGLPPREEIEFVERLIRHVLVPMRFNAIFFEFAGGMEYTSHPEISAAWKAANEKAWRGEAPPVPHGGMVADGGCLTREEVRRLVRTARTYGIEVIPEVQSLSHVQFLTLAHPEVAEIPARREGDGRATDVEKEDAPPPATYAHCSCALSEEAYRIQYDLIDEIVETVEPERFVHMGHDEVYQIGVCERCRDHDPAELFALHVKRMHAHLEKKGLGMMIWADMLHDCTRYRTPPAIDRIPKDIVLLDFIWYFHLDRDIETRLLDRGFRVLFGNLYSSHFPRYESRRKRAGIDGGQVSTWVRADEYHLAVNGKFFDLLYTANMMWSAAYDHRLRRTYTRCIERLLPRIRDGLRGARSPSRMPRAGFVPLTVAAGEPVQARNLWGMPFSIGSGLPVQSGRVRASAFPEEIEVKVGLACASLVLLHACEGNSPREPWKPLVRIGTYEIEYGDGGRVTVPIEYGGIVAASDRLYAEPMPHAMYRHQGYMATYLADPVLQERKEDGTPFTVYAFEWINPRPDEPVRRVLLRADGETDAVLVLLGITAVRPKSPG